MDVAVYLFTGFLEAGKTTLIQETLEDSGFNSGEPTLVLSCEEGMGELDATSFAKGNVFFESIDTLSRLNPDKLSALQRKYKAERVLVEYNGMWMNEDFYNAMPENWFIYQEIMVADATTFVNYNTNMRSLTVSKMSNAEMIVFNRFDANKIDRMELHKIVRGISRRANIAYEYEDHEIEYDTIEDPLPFDLEAPVVEIANRDYAIWYRDMSEDLEKYKGKTIRLTGMVARDPKLPSDAFVIGRHVMTCCADDITFCGLICMQKGKCELESKDWVTVTAKMDVAFHKLYGSKGPIFKIESCTPAEPLVRDEQVASFY